MAASSSTSRPVALIGPTGRSWVPGGHRTKTFSEMANDAPKNRRTAARHVNDLPVAALLLPNDAAAATAAAAPIAPPSPTSQPEEYRLPLWPNTVVEARDQCRELAPIVRRLVPALEVAEKEIAEAQTVSSCYHTFVLK
jgi:hypothetical protein